MKSIQQAAITQRWVNLVFQDIGKTNLMTVEQSFDRIVPTKIDKIITSQTYHQELYGKVIDMTEKFLLLPGWAIWGDAFINYRT
ncbi:hypothetical protein BG74_05830 [Sodalis-like endosymbiont of Proechinophthirus fluctus]|uniref:hypothetical protein n=1 Tax=Sodalis-like endosymbiont of Proechinophthirus fluctus TaxID=1462730 RepID=UPI0007A8A9B9|nr:hypothetical protein [Sodalis-like endosymbiont of Proechinophthirus fluctus]KYP97055.1 hypothetical protein BG74_05830 [Sodalis-like endosymbiont of Proechinophthirus fluctus]